MFTSTHPNAAEREIVSFEEALSRPIPSEGHLWVPTLPLPEVEWPRCGAELHAFVSVAVHALTGHEFNFESTLSVCPIYIDETSQPLVLDLSLGPTKSFKDVGCLCAAKMYRELGMTTKRTVVATSGDTGSAAAYAFCQANLPITVIYPKNRVSPFQATQMVEGSPGACVMAVEGDFDACQRAVKEIIGRGEAKSCNSISLARLLPQIGYYAYFASRFPHRVIIVPSGNFGNACAAEMARMMGAPIAGVHFACNMNDAAARFVQGIDAEFSPRATEKTLAMAMDIGHPSNLIRIQYLCGHDTSEFRRRFTASVSTDDDIRRMMGRNSTLCPHTAVAAHAASGLSGIRMCIVQTADARKFTSDFPMPYAPTCMRPEKLARPIRNVVLIGMPSSGKSTIANIMNGLDTDRIIESRCEKPLHEVIRECESIDAFIDLEARIASETILLPLREHEDGVLNPRIIATGGSVVYTEQFRNSLSDSFVVWLECDLPSLSERLGDTWNSRGVISPTGAHTLENLYEERCSLFEKIADVRIDTMVWKPWRIATFLRSRLHGQ